MALAISDSPQTGLDLHALKLRLQQHFRDGLVTVVGSGLSCAEDLPGMGTLGNHLRAVIGDDLSPEDLDAWHSIDPLIAKKGLESALLEIAPSANLEAKIAAATAEYIAEHERRVITEVFEGKRILRFSRLLRHLLKPATGIPVVTTNYDRLIEIAAEEAGLGVDTMFVGQFAGEFNERESRLSFCRDAKMQGKSVRFLYRDRVLVCKPHGSLDWYYRDGKPVRYAGDLPGVPRLIIPPGRNKFRNGYESPFDRHRERANHTIDRASRFLVIGYGFNDDHLETHLTPAIRAGAPTLLLARTLSPTAAELAHTHSNVIGLERAELDGTDGTRVIADQVEAPLPGIALWDLGNFVTEVLEP